MAVFAALESNLLYATIKSGISKKQIKDTIDFHESIFAYIKETIAKNKSNPILIEFFAYKCFSMSTCVSASNEYKKAPPAAKAIIYVPKLTNPFAAKGFAICINKYPTNIK